MKNRRPLKKRILVWVFLVLALSVLLTFFRPFWYIGCVRETVWQNGFLYGVDEWNGKLRLFACDASGKNAWVETIYNQDLSHPVFYALEEMTVSEEGLCDLFLAPQEVTEESDLLHLQYDLNERNVILTEDVAKELPPDVHIQQERAEGTWTVRTDGSLWLSGTDGSEKMIFANDGTQVSKDNSVYTFGNEGLYFYNTEEDGCYVIDYETKTLSKADLPFPNPIRTYGDLFSLRQMKDGTWTATFYTEDGNLLPMAVGESAQPILRLSSPLQEALQSMAMLVVILFLAGVCIYFVVKQIRRTFPTTLKIICLSIPFLMAYCAFFQVCIQNFLKDDVQSRIDAQMYYTADILESQIDFASAFAKRSTIDFQGILHEKNTSREVYGSDGAVFTHMNGTVGNVTVFGHVEEGFYCANAQSLSTTSAPMFRYPGEEEILQEVVETKKTMQSSAYFYSLGSCLLTYHPIFDGQTVVGVTRVMYPEIHVTYEIMDRLVELVSNVFLFLMALMVCLTVLCFLLLRPLKKSSRPCWTFPWGWICGA